MKIWCVDHAGLTFHTYSELFFTKEEAKDRYDSLYAGPGSYRKMYQVEDIWGWCGRHFNEVILEVLRSRDDGDDAIYIFGLVNELREAAEHCKLEHFRIEGFWVNRYEFALNIAWFHEGQLHMDTRHFDGNDKFYEYPTIVERRSKYEAQNG
jgi:hypothetical protein